MCVCVCVCESKYGSESDIMNRVEKQHYLLNSFDLHNSVFLLCSHCRIQIHIYFHTILLKKNKYQMHQNNLYIWKLTYLCVFL